MLTPNDFRPRVNAVSRVAIRHCLTALGCLAALSAVGCCPRHYPGPISFNLATPIEAYAPLEEPKIMFALKLTNTSTFQICVARRENGAWKRGLVPYYTVDLGDAPITVSATALNIDSLAKTSLKQGRSFSGAQFQLIVQPKPGTPTGTKGTFRFHFGLHDETTKPGAAEFAAVDIPIDFLVRQPGLPVLISLPVQFNSRSEKFPW